MESITQIDVKKEEDTAAREQLLVFSLEDEEYALDILQCRQIINTPVITPIPGSPDFIRGVINLRGKIIVVVDLEKKIHVDPKGKAKGSQIVIVEIGGRLVGLVVDSVSEVAWVKAEDIKAPPETLETKSGMEYIKNVAIQKSRLMIILDLERLLDHEELKNVNAIHEAYGQ